MYQFWAWIPKTGREFWNVNIGGLGITVEPKDVGWVSREEPSRINPRALPPWNHNITTAPIHNPFPIIMQG